ncbi:MAG: hypothetical protein U9N77_01450 [Thermodesulfobacteriota bacterium]|nr:hypothetical protein [Thermodesulfobacteriota bacterium]
MKFNITKIFIPSRGVELAFNLSSLHPTAKSSIIYDVDHDHRLITLAQPITPITSNTKFMEMHLTTLVSRGNEKKRVGLQCMPVQFNNNYRLSNNKIIDVITVNYSLPAIETNIRSAYRLPLSNEFSIKAVLTQNENEFNSQQDFVIRDISLSGIGIVIPKKIKERLNPLAKTKVRQQAEIKLTLLEKGEKKALKTIPSIIETARININHSDSTIFAGIKFIRLSPGYEDILNKFIHNAQIAELKRFSGV